MYALKTVKGWYELTTAKLVPWRRQISFYVYFLCLSFLLIQFYSNHLKCWKAKSNIAQF